MMGASTKFLSLFLFFFMFLLSLVYADCLNNVQYIITSNAGEYIAIALSLMILVIVFAYMAGHFLEKPEYTVFAKDELFHMGVSAVMLVTIGSVFMLACAVSGYFINSALSIHYAKSGTQEEGCFVEYKITENATKLATCFLSDIEKDGRNLLKTSVKGEISEQLWSSWATTIYFPLMGGVTTPTAAYKKAASMQHGMMYNMFIVPSLIAISMQKILVQFLSDSALTFFLPAGLFFRIIPQFRQMGNLLIAVAVGLYVILPVAYAVNAAMYNLVFKDCPTYNSLISDFVQGDCGSPSSFWAIGKLIPQAFFLPNLTLALFITYLSAANKALRVIA